MIGTFFGQLAFTAPWALSALLALPALYFLLRITPPAPVRLVFPAARFLEGLNPQTQTPSQTPLWILLIRMAAIALLLLAMSGPVLNPANPLAGNGPLRLVIDNGWSAAQNWTAIQGRALELAAQAGRENRSLILQTTAPVKGGDAPTPSSGLLSSGEAAAMIRSLKPLPWPRDLRRLRFDNAGDATVWLSDGVQNENESGLLSAALTKLREEGPVTIQAPARENLPMALRAPETPGGPLSTILYAPGGRFTFKAPVRVQATDAKGDILDDVEIAASGPVKFNLPASLSGKAARLQIAGQRGAQSLYLLDSQSAPKTVGIVSSGGDEAGRPLGDEAFFLGKALEPYAQLKTGALGALLADKPSVLILPDIAGIPADTLNALDEWVRGGGLLLRFAGINMTRADTETALIPVKIRREERTVEGSLSWDKPLKIAPVDPASPLYGLSIPADVEIRRQILPEPSDDLAERTWMRLTDGTPLVTGAPHGAGMLVMVHTSATPSWSNLPLSGLYVGMLRRITGLAGRPLSEAMPTGGLLQPVRTMDGFGGLQEPAVEAQAIDAANFEAIGLSPEHPPGIYGHGPHQRILNAGDHLGDYEAIGPAAMGQPLLPYADHARERSLAPLLAALAFIILLLDLAVMAMLGRGWLTKHAALALLFVTCSFPAMAQSPETPERAASALYMAYIKTGQPELDAQTAQGLEVMRRILLARTSAEMQGVAALDPETDILSFYPLIYWTVSPAQTTLPAKAYENLQNYLDHGGTLVIDTRDGASGQNGEALKRLMAGLNVQPLVPLPEDHVLTKSFYLLKTFPGRADDKTLWVEAQSTGRDGVSSVILTGNDWAGAWAELNIGGDAPRYYAMGATRTQELSLRSGVNLMLYALTGNYKADQVHVPAILERLGKNR